MILAALRVGEMLGLRWRDVDLARGRLTVAEAKTRAGERVIDLSPDLLSELKQHKASVPGARPASLVFPTSTGAQGKRWNVSKRVLGRAVEAANVKRAKDGLPPSVGVTNHSLRRTFASLMYEAGASPAYVMGAMAT
jgi:integrase